MEKQRFKEWLIKNGYTENTSVSYSYAIDKISNNENYDVYTLSDLSDIEKLVEAYSTTGEHSEIGYEGKGTVRNGIKAYYKFKKDLDNDDGMLYELTDDEIADQFIYGFSYKGHIRKSIFEYSSVLFPNYKILNRQNKMFEYSNEESSVDILLENNDGNLLAVKIEPGVAGMNVFGELATHIGFLIEKHPEKKVSGLIIAGEIESSLKHASKITNMISLKTYKMNLELQDIS